VTKTSFVSGVEFIGVSLSVQCHPRMGSTSSRSTASQRP
jgi:hypothetical protein